MKDIKDYIVNEGLFTKKKPNRPSAFKSENQQWDNWCASIIRKLTYAYEDYKKKNPDYNFVREYKKEHR